LASDADRGVLPLSSSGNAVAPAAKVSAAGGPGPAYVNPSMVNKTFLDTWRGKLMCRPAWGFVMKDLGHGDLCHGDS
jgi:hypothetical protein